MRAVDGVLHEVTRCGSTRFLLQDSLDFAIRQIIVNAITAQQDTVTRSNNRLCSVNGDSGIFFMRAITQALRDAVAFIKNLAFYIR